MFRRQIYGCVLIVSGLLGFQGCHVHGLSGEQAMDRSVSSPDGKIKVSFGLNEEGQPFYSVTYDGKTVLRPSPLGLVRSDGAFDTGLSVTAVSKTEPVKDDYTMLTGKRKECTYRANRKVLRLKNADGQSMEIVFQVSNDGAAFRYGFEEKTGQPVYVTDEKTGFALAEDTLSWLHFMAVSKSGWSRTQPSYEEYYEAGKPVGRPSPAGQGWCLPALFKTADGIWVLICDSDVNDAYFGARLGHDSTGGMYRIALPQVQDHRGPQDPATPQIGFPFRSPWRVLMIGPSPATMVESTLMTDVATPSKIKDAGFIKPGKASWTWLRYDNDGSTLTYAESFLNLAVRMKWEYVLVDANWDQLIGYERMAEFVRKANDQGVGVILWYNSNGPWNDAPMTPKNRMHNTDVRREEFARLRAMGVKGVKVDFFAGDKQATMQLYLETLRDAADFGLLVNFHGATIPRGWQRTWPNLMTMESVRGMEYCTFEQSNADRQPWHCTILPFTRNAIGSMDFTPVVLNPRIRGVRLVTLPGFEIALPVVFESGIQHMGLVPEETGLLTEAVVKYLQAVLTVWDETRLVDGLPGEYVVIARRSGDTWYVAGINGLDVPKALTLNLSFLPAGAKGTLITDGEDRSFEERKIGGGELRSMRIELKPHGGFVLTTEK